MSCGPGAALSHASAAALWGIRPQPRRTDAHVSVRYGGDRNRPGVRLHRVKLARRDVTTRDGIPVVTPARTLLNQAAVLTPRRLEADINAADIHGLVTPQDLRKALRYFGGLPGVVALRELLDRHTFTLTDSALERMFLPLARRAGLPAPCTQQRVNGFRVDFFWPGLGLVVETDGLRYHRTPVQQSRDLIREQTHRGAGIEPLRFTHWQVAHDQAWVAGTLRRVGGRLDAARRRD
jgi:very-short-patch-repair endonuclease